MNRLVVIGDVLLDRDIEGTVRKLCPDAPVPVLEERSSRSRPGGAGLAASLLAADGCQVTLVTALAADPAAAELAYGLSLSRIDLVDLGQDGTTPEKIRLRAGQTLARLDRGRPGAMRATGMAPALAAITADAAAILVSDYGQGITASAEVRYALEYAAGEKPVLWDPHPRGAGPVPGTAIVKPNLSEAMHFAGLAEEPGSEAEATAMGRRLARSWRAGAVCITRGEESVLLAERDHAGPGTLIPVEPARGDVCGAGDRFAATLARELAAGTGSVAGIEAAVAEAASFVASGGAKARNSGGGGGSGPDARQGAASSRRGTVVATGGCFDLLHSGHVRSLEAAARLGDRLVVLLNSDRSVREIKGPDRPLIAEAERAHLLRALACVDEVIVFDEATPIEALRRLKPDVWAKGADYEADQLPERDEVARWGGRLAILPYIEGRSTTNLIEEAGSRATA